MCKSERESIEGLTNLIEIKGIIAGHGAVEARLEVRRPAVPESMWSTFVPFADTGHSGVHSLDVDGWRVQEEINWIKCQIYATTTICYVCMQMHGQLQ